MKKQNLVILSGLIGIITGYFCSITFFAHSWITIILWVIVGLIVGLFCNRTKKSYKEGYVFGFFVTVSFLLFNFSGTSSKFFGFVILSILLGVVGAFCGALVVRTGLFIKRSFKQIR
jgi:uncharacterized membrane protein YeaQ/YmgE (transglycosylase-associated protein family)